MVLVEGDYCTEVEHKCKKSGGTSQQEASSARSSSPRPSALAPRSKKRYCIDKYEWPNKKGERPEVMNRFHQAQVKCASVGKRMCTESEWTSPARART
jgi:sulfatase modifying factor 1